MACVHQNYHCSRDKSVCCDRYETISCAIQAFPPQALHDSGDNQPNLPDAHECHGHCWAATPLLGPWPMRFFQSVKVATLQREMTSKR